MAEWISVKDRLPEEGKEVLVFAIGKLDNFIGETAIAISDYTNISLVPQIIHRMGWRAPWQYFLTDYEITHWMPLPEPPVKGE